MSKETVRILERLKGGSPASGSPPPSQDQRRVATPAKAAATASPSHTRLHQSVPSKKQKAGPSEPAEESQQPFDDFRPVEDNVDEDDFDQGPLRSTSEYVSTWEAYAHDKNKENRPISGRDKEPTIKRRLLDRQANARKVQWESQDENVAPPSNRKRPRQEPEPSADTISEDEGFEADRRNPSPSRRMAAPTGRRRSPVPATQSPPKRARVQDDGEEVEPRRRNRQRAEAALQASARQEGSDEDDEPKKPGSA